MIARALATLSRSVELNQYAAKSPCDSSRGTTPFQLAPVLGGHQLRGKGTAGCVAGIDVSMPQRKRAVGLADGSSPVSSYRSP